LDPGSGMTDKGRTVSRPPLLYWGMDMVESEREMLREAEEAKLGERRPFESSRQATYEDTFGPASEYEHDESD